MKKLLRSRLLDLTIPYKGKSAKPLGNVLAKSLRNACEKNCL